jgi:hypothetical protein
MANVKAVRIDAVVPFDFLEHLSDDKAAMLARWFLSPSIGLRLDYDGAPAGYEPNEHGGKTAMYRLCVRGEEAIRFEAFKHVVGILKSVGRVDRAVCVDVEGGGA